MLAYLDDYRHDGLIPSYVRTRRNVSSQNLITELYKYIVKGKNGTMPWDLRNGLTTWYNNYMTQSARDYYKIVSTNYGTYNLVKATIDNGQPIAVGLLGLLGSTYGDHWVTAYAYDHASDLNNFYRVVDNWGNPNSYNARVAVGWTIGAVGLQRK